MPKTRELTEAERMAIYTKRQAGATLQVLATEYNICVEGVRKIINKVETTGSVQNLPRSGRHRATTEREDRAIVRLVKTNPNISARETKERLNLNVAEETIRNRLHEANLFGRIARNKPHINECNRKKRLEFAMKYVDFRKEFWRDVLWTDESRFEVRGDNTKRKYVWRKPNTALAQKNIRPTFKSGRESVLVWGCFTYMGVGKIAFIDGNFKSNDYIKILEDNLPDTISHLKLEDDFIFQQDNDPKHTSQVTKSFLKNNQLHVLPWPPQSPDLNPIEHLWDYLDRQITLEERCSKEIFQSALERHFYAIPEEYCHQLVDSMPNRLREVIKANGLNTRY